MSVGILILAAGSSRRFGSDKRRVLLANGKRLLQQSMENALASGLSVAVAVREGEEDFAMFVTLPTQSSFGIDAYLLAILISQRYGDLPFSSTEVVQWCGIKGGKAELNGCLQDIDTFTVRLLLAGHCAENDRWRAQV